MSVIIPPQPAVSRRHAASCTATRCPFSARSLACVALLAASFIAPASALADQGQAASSTCAPVKKTVAHPHKRPSATHHAAAKPSPATVAVPVATVSAPEPPKPELPKWPANQDPTVANVVWDSHGLRIDASNSSLSEILKEVSTSTGLKVEGMGSDQRIFGAFGPGPARDVLAQLLEGTGYNVLMIGDQGQGTPRQLVLSTQHAGDPAQLARGSASANSDDDADTEEPQPQPQPTMPPIRPGFTPGQPPRTPQQIMQEMQERQQMQLQQQPQ